MRESQPKKEGLSVLECMASIVFLVALGCAPKMPPPETGVMTGYDRLDAVAATADGFEIAPADLDPAEVVPLDLLQGPHHVVRSVRLDNRFLYTYRVDSDHGEIEVTGRGLLRKRIIELEALASFKVKRFDRTRLYAYEVANAASEPIEGTLQILRHPFRTVINVPKSAIVSFKALREMSSMGRTHLEDDYFEEFIGLSGQKREWADRMGVDPYSTNEIVQSKLKRNSRYSWAGGLTVSLATMAIPAGGASILMSVVGATSGMNEQLRDIAPEDIRVNSRSWLSKTLGVEGELADRFLQHPWYSPSRQETIMRALARMEGAENRSAFIEMAAKADEPHEAFTFTRLALMFAECHERRAAIGRFFPAHDLIVAQTVDGEVVLPLYMDHGYWTTEVAQAELEISSELYGELGSTRRLLLVSGHMTPRASQELNARGWEVIASLEDLWLSDLDVARYQPVDSDEDRILPEIGR
jgi:hypothetical protein